MKYFWLLLICQSAFAVPFTCVSLEKVGQTPVVKFKVNARTTYVDTRGNEWNPHRIGVTPAEGFREVVYGQGQADDREIALTLVKDDFVLGKIIAAAPRVDGRHEGIFQMAKIGRGRELKISCERSP